MATTVFQLDGANIPFGRVKNGCKAFPPLLCMFITVAMNKHEPSSRRAIVAVVQRKSFTQFSRNECTCTLHFNAFPMTRRGRVSSVNWPGLSFT